MQQQSPPTNSISPSDSNQLHQLQSPLLRFDTQSPPLTSRNDLPRTYSDSANAPKTKSQGGKGAAAFAPVVRQKQKVVPLPEQDTLEQDLSDLTDATKAGSGRIGVHCLSESFQRDLLQTLLTQGGYGKVQPHPDLIHLKLEQEQRDAFFFDYGVVIFWGMDLARERAWIKQILMADGCQVDPYHPDLIEQDEFAYVSSEHERPNVANDVFTLGQFTRGGLDSYKISISQALAQSTKLSVFEEKVQRLAETTKRIPEVLAKDGKVAISSHEMAKLIGEVFIQRSEVNLLSTVLDTPEYFWNVPDTLQKLYKNVRSYLELDTRTEVLNTRLQLLTDMLDIVRDHENSNHATRLETVIIVLILIEVIIGVFECLSMAGVFPRGE